MFVNSGVSTIQGLLKYSNEWKDSRDFRNCLLYCGCPLLRVFIKQGSTVFHTTIWFKELCMELLLTRKHLHEAIPWWHCRRCSVVEDGLTRQRRYLQSPHVSWMWNVGWLVGGERGWHSMYNKRKWSKTWRQGKPWNQARSDMKEEWGTACEGSKLVSVEDK